MAFAAGSFDLHFAVAQALAVFVPFTLVVAAVLRQLKSQGWENASRIMVLLLVMPFYGFFQTALTLYARVRMIFPFKWKVTQRKRVSVQVKRLTQSLLSQHKGSEYTASTHDASDKSPNSSAPDSDMSSINRYSL